MNNRSVVIVDYIYDFPNKSSRGYHNVEDMIKRKNKILENRALELGKIQNKEIEFSDSFEGVFYPSIEEKFPLKNIKSEKQRVLLSSEKITLALFQDILDRNTISNKKDLLLSIGTANTDIFSKIHLMNLNRDSLAELFELIDPLGYIKLLNFNGSFAIESISEASTSGMGSLYNSYLKIKRGEFDIALSGGASAITFPIPYEVSRFGMGRNRYVNPFEEAASGHYFSEGGVAFLLKERQQAIEDGDCILAEIKDISFGTMGNVVVNRNAVKKLVIKSFRNAEVSEESKIFLELYGRGNEVDDAAEFSCLKNLKKKYRNLKGGFLKENVQYIVGHYGMIGLCRLLDSKENQTPILGSLINQPNKFIHSIDGDLWTNSVTNYDLISILSYSMHGNMYNLLVNFEEKDVGNKGGVEL